MSFAISSGLPHLFKEVSSASFFLSSFDSGLYVVGVAMLPRATVYALILYIPYVLAIFFVSDISELFANVYAAPSISPDNVGIDDMLTITPKFCFIIIGMHSLTSLNEPKKSTLYIFKITSSSSPWIFFFHIFKSNGKPAKLIK